MQGNRKAAEAMILKFFKEYDASGYNLERWKQILEDMSDKDFHEYMVDIRDGKKTLIAFAPLFRSKGITVENNLALAKKYDIPMFERIKITGDPNIPDHYTEHEVLVLGLPMRVQAQTLDNKISVPANNKVIDHLTYQPTGPSKGSKLSAQELRVMTSMGMHNSAEELGRARGGDKGMFRAMNAMGEQVGSISLNQIIPYQTGVESTKTVKKYFYACMLHFKD